MDKFSASFSHLGRKLEVYSTEKSIQRTSSPMITADCRERKTSKSKNVSESLPTEQWAPGVLIYLDSRSKQLRDTHPLIWRNRMYPEKRSLNTNAPCLHILSTYNTALSHWVLSGMAGSQSSHIIVNEPCLPPAPKMPNLLQYNILRYKQTKSTGSKPPVRKT